MQRCNLVIVILLCYLKKGMEPNFACIQIFFFEISYEMLTRHVATCVTFKAYSTEIQRNKAITD